MAQSGLSKWFGYQGNANMNHKCLQMLIPKDKQMKIGKKANMS